MMDTNEYLESGILELYVMGTLSESEMSVITAKIRENPQLKAEVIRLEEALLAYSGLHSPIISTLLKKQILNIPKQSSSSFINGISFRRGFLSVLVFSIGVYVAYRYYQKPPVANQIGNEYSLNDKDSLENESSNAIDTPIATTNLATNSLENTFISEVSPSLLGQENQFNQPTGVLQKNLAEEDNESLTSQALDIDTLQSPIQPPNPSLPSNQTLENIIIEEGEALAILPIKKISKEPTKIVSKVRHQKLVIGLRSFEKDPRFNAKINWDITDQIMRLDASFFPKPPIGKTYQLWALYKTTEILPHNGQVSRFNIINRIRLFNKRKFTPVDLGVLDMDNLDGKKFFEIKTSFAQKPDAYVITIAPKKGRKSPNYGNIFVYGQRYIQSN